MHMHRLLPIDNLTTERADRGIGLLDRIGVRTDPGEFGPKRCNSGIACSKADQLDDNAPTIEISFSISLSGRRLPIVRSPLRPANTSVPPGRSISTA